MMMMTLLPLSIVLTAVHVQSAILYYSNVPFAMVCIQRKNLTKVFVFVATGSPINQILTFVAVAVIILSASSIPMKLVTQMIFITRESVLPAIPRIRVKLLTH